ncbi:MAG: hypothetical protein QOI71_1193 [Gaiellales bacterium]|jgi:hypothetical protein|nr:hypothetical protein [Gaiellales bacterium]MDX6618522.1 hypothetical protein [Gaiellales bacterium]
MRSLRTAVLAAVLLALPAAATAAPQPTLFPSGRYAAVDANASLSFMLERLQITRLQVRMPLSCQNTRTHAHSTPTLAFAAGAGTRTTTYSRIFLPADGATNVSFVVDDNARQPAIYLSLQLRGAGGHVSVHARSQAARETCAGAVGFDVRAR